jgi:shikimate kinase
MSVIQEIKDLIEESFKLDKNNNYEMNFDLWKNGTNKTLYITGLMGSGKSTFAKKLSEEYNAKLIELDTIQKNTFDKFGEVVDDEIYLTEFFKKLNKEISNSKKIIVEGVQIYHVPNFLNIIKPTDSVLIINTGVIKSTFRSIKRDGLKQIFNNIDNNLHFQKYMGEFRNEFNSRN